MLGRKALPNLPAYIADGRPHKAMEIYPKLKALSPGDGELLKRLATDKVK